MTKKFLFCKKCCNYPNDIIIEQVTPSRRYASWNGKDNYSDIDENYDMYDERDEIFLCNECETPLLEIEFNDLTEKQRAKIIAKNL